MLGREASLKYALRCAAVGLLGPALVGCGGDHEKQVESSVSAHETAAPPAADIEEEPSATVLSWTGCGISKKAYMTEAAKEYFKATGVSIVVTGGGATRGIRATVGGLSDIGGTCRHCLPEQFPDTEEGAVLTHVAWDALVFFTHPENPVSDLTRQQAKDVLKGKVTNWRELGGEDEKIVPSFRRQTVRGKLSGVGYMTRLMLFGNPMEDYTEDAIFHTSSGPLEEFVESTEYAFGVTGVSSARKRTVKILALDGMDPTHENIASGDYPLFRPLYLVTKGPPSGAAKEFLDWILSDKGQAVLSHAGTVNLAEGAALKARFGHWPADTSVIWNY
jgi:phosphate transport system substrate-binding protein